MFISCHGKKDIPRIKNRMHKFSDETVEDIRRLYATGLGYEKIQKYHHPEMTIGNVAHIIKGRTRVKPIAELTKEKEG